MTSDPELNQREAPATRMAGDSPSNKPVGIRRLFIGTNVVLQILIFCALVAMANYLSFRHNRQLDYTRDKAYTLSGQTTTLLANLKKDMRAIVLLEPLGPLRGDIVALLQEYEKKANKRFRVEFLSLYSDPQRGKELVSKYKLNAQDRVVIILDYDGRSKFVPGTELATFGSFLSERSGKEEAMITEFKGEAAITSRMLELVDETPAQVYYVSGHGEAPLDTPTIGHFHDLFRRQNGTIKQVSLSDVSEIPADAKALIVNGPQSDFSARELKMLDAYWQKKGRLLICTNPAAKLENLKTWLADQGVVVQDDRVLATQAQLDLDKDKNVVMGTAVLISPRARFLPEGEKVVRDMAGRNTAFFGPTQSIKLNMAMVKPGQLVMVPLAEAAKGFWGETNYQQLDSGTYLPLNEPNSDNVEKIYIAVAAEKGGVSQPNVRVDSSRMVVVGNGSLLDAEAIKDVGENNVFFALNALNWLLDRNVGMGIPPRPRSDVILKLENSKIRNISLTTIILVPLGVAVMGLLVCWQRRS